MPLTRDLRLRVRPAGGPVAEEKMPGPGAHQVGGLEFRYSLVASGQAEWSITNLGPDDRALDAVALVWDHGPAGTDPRMFVHGYQSWAPSRVRRLGIDEDPSRDPRTLALVRAAFHADPSPASTGELRSEQVTVIEAAGRRHLIGFGGGARHAGTIRARIVDGRVEIATEAWLGGAVLRAGETRELHPAHIDEGDDPNALLEQWATRVGASERARVGAPFTVGWCSWYHYFHDVTATAMHANLAQSTEWPFDVFQLDDGYQRSIGDWLHTNEKFPRGIDAMADAIARSGHTPGIWLAPFLAAPDSALATKHLDWLARAPEGDGFAIGMFHPVWGGVMAELDTTNPEVLHHLEETASELVATGYRYLKLDFTFSAAMPGRYADPTKTPAERVRAGYDAIRRGAGDDVFIVGCGAPLGAVVGAVDAMRIGADVAPWWNAPADAVEQQPGYEETTPATRHAFVNTCTRSFMHRRLWLNDPDCVMLRTSDTGLSPAAATGWARIVGASGGLILVSDDLALLGPPARRLLDEVIEAGRAADAAATEGITSRPIDVFAGNGPVGLAGPHASVTLDPSSGEEQVGDLR